MNKNLRAGLLIALLAVPAFLFLFLKFFGENQFDLPYLFSPGTGAVEEYADLEYAEFLSQPKTQDSVYFRLLDTNLALKESTILFLYDDDQDLESHKEELKRISTKIENRPEISLLTLKNEGLNPKAESHLNTVYQLRFRKEKPEVMLFLLDEENYFRGAYDPSFKSEFDRLVIEYQILLKF